MISSLRFPVFGFLLLFTSFSLAQDEKKIPVTQSLVMVEDIIEITKVQADIETSEAPSIASKVSAEVIKVHVDEGEVVKTNQILAEMDDEEFLIAIEARQAEIDRLKVLIENQQRTLDRNIDLLKNKVINQSRVDDADAVLRQSKAQLAQAKALLKQSEYQHSHSTIRSPINGVIQKRNVSKGDYVNPGTIMFQIIKTDQLRARLYIPENMVKRIQVGMLVQLEIDSQSLNAEITQIRPMLETDNRVLHGLVEFENDYAWKPGMNVTARVILDQRPQGLTIPIASIVQRPSGAVVYRIENAIAQEQVIKTGVIQGERIEVTEGLSAGEQIVLEGAGYLTDGVSLNIKESQE